MSLKKRVPTAFLLLAVVFVWIQYFSPVLFFIFLQIMILAALWEFYNLFSKRNIYLPKILGMAVSLVIGISFFGEHLSLELALFISLLLGGVYFLLATNKIEKVTQFPTVISLTFFGGVFLSFCLNHFYLLKTEKGAVYIYFFLAVIFVGDTGAYFIGKLWGRHKMAPLASPGKTWEGSVGGMLFACGTGVGFVFIFLSPDVLGKGVVCAFLVHLVAQISDPVESLFKRAVGVKDSSHILPGHGGMLDRVDSLILGTPFFYYLLNYLKLG